MLPEVKLAEWNKGWSTRAIFWVQEPRKWAKLVRKACRVHIAQECPSSMVAWISSQGTQGTWCPSPW